LDICHVVAKFYDDDSLICSYATSPTEAVFCAERGLFSPASAKGEIEGEMQKIRLSEAGTQ